MKELIDGLIPRILPEGVSFLSIPHEGKSDLEKSIPRKIRSWRDADPNVKFVIVHDQDSNNCVELKSKLLGLCKGRESDVLVRIPCHELEAWYFGDLDAVEAAYDLNLNAVRNKAKYRVPDAIVSPKQELKKIIPQHQQIDGAKRIAKYMDISRNTSRSFQVFVEGIQRICGV